jgi:hypothetical protein
MTNVEFIAVFVAAVASWLVGALWYMALGQTWLRALGKTKDDLMAPSGKPSPAPFIISFLAELVMALVLAVLVARLGPVTVSNGIAAAFLAWIGFVATSMVVNHRFGGARPMLTVIDSGHWLAVLMAQGIVIGLFGA